MGAADFGLLELYRVLTVRQYQPADLLDPTAVPAVLALPQTHSAQSAAFVLEDRVLLAVVLDPNNITCHMSKCVASTKRNEMKKKNPTKLPPRGPEEPRALALRLSLGARPGR